MVLFLLRKGPWKGPVTAFQLECTNITFSNLREKPVWVKEMEIHLALSTLWLPNDQEPLALSPAPTMHLCLFACCQGFPFIYFTWHYNQPSGSNLSIIPWHWGHKWRATAQLQGLSLAVPTSHNVQIVHFDQMQNKIFLTTYNNCSCYYKTMFIEEHLNCSARERIKYFFVITMVLIYIRES